MVRWPYYSSDHLPYKTRIRPTLRSTDGWACMRRGLRKDLPVPCSWRGPRSPKPSRPPVDGRDQRREQVSSEASPRAFCQSPKTVVSSRSWTNVARTAACRIFRSFSSWLNDGSKLLIKENQRVDDQKARGIQIPANNLLTVVHVREDLEMGW